MIVVVNDNIDLAGFAKYFNSPQENSLEVLCLENFLQKEIQEAVTQFNDEENTVTAISISNEHKINK